MTVDGALLFLTATVSLTKNTTAVPPILTIRLSRSFAPRAACGLPQTSAKDKDKQDIKALGAHRVPENQKREVYERVRRAVEAKGSICTNHKVGDKKKKEYCIATTEGYPAAGGARVPRAIHAMSALVAQTSVFGLVPPSNLLQLDHFRVTHRKERVLNHA